MLLEGLHLPLTTPFHPDGRLNARRLAANVVHYSLTPAAGLIVLGPSGEPTLLSDDETREVLRTAAEAAAPEKVLIAGISRDSVDATLALADFAASLHYDAVLVGPPSVHIAPRELLTYFRTVGDHSPLPIILLSVSPEAAAELATHPNIIALLDPEAHDATAIKLLLQRTAATKRDVTVTPVFAAVTARMKQAAGRDATLVSAASLTATASAVAEPPAMPLRTRTKTIGFQVLAGHTATMLDGLHAGSVGIAPALAAAAPQACFEVFAAWKDDDQPLAEEKQSRLREAAHVAESTPGTLKFAADFNGYCGGHPRLPHLPPTGEQRAALEPLMKEVHN